MWTILCIVTAIVFIGLVVYMWLCYDEPLVLGVIPIIICTICSVILLFDSEETNAASAESETQVIESAETMLPNDTDIAIQIADNQRNEIAAAEGNIEANSDADKNNEINGKQNVEKDDAINESNEIAENILDVMILIMVAVLLFSLLSASDIPDAIADFIGSCCSKRQEKEEYEKSKSNDNTEEGGNDDGTDAKTLSMRDFIVQISNLNAEIAECGLSRELNAIVKLLQAICKLADSGLTHSSLHRMETYYLPELVNLLTYYKNREKQREKFGEVNNTLISIENNARKIKQALRQMYSEMLGTEALPVSVASTVMDSELAKDFAQNEFKNENK